MRAPGKTNLRLKSFTTAFAISVLAVLLILWQNPLFAGAEELANLAEDHTTAPAKEPTDQKIDPQTSEAPTTPIDEEAPAIPEDDTIQQEPDTVPPDEERAIVPFDDEVLDTRGEQTSEQGAQALQPEADEITPRATPYGTCGTCAWNFNEATGELSIGAGTLGSFNFAQRFPWFPYSSRITSVTFTGMVYTAEAAAGLFYEMINLAQINNIKRLKTTSTTDMQGMFYNCRTLTSLDLSGFNTVKTTNMAWMFNGCSSLQSITLSSFSTGNVITMTSMFNGCSSLESLSLSNFSTGKVTNLSSMFYQCTSLKSLDLSSFSTGNVISMSSMFSGCTNLGSVNLSSFTTPSVLNMSTLFYDCSKLRKLSLGTGFYFLSADSYPPVPVGLTPQNKPYSGLWKAASNGATYTSNEIPQNRADTYEAEILSPSLSISGEQREGAQLTATVSGGGTLPYTYRWSRSATATGSFFPIAGATNANYSPTVADADQYLSCSLRYSGELVASAKVGPIQGLPPQAPSLNSAVLNADGKVLLTYITAANADHPYASLVVQHRLGSAAWEDYGELPSTSSTTETKTATLDLASVFESGTPPSAMSFRIKAKNTRGESSWSNIVDLDTSPQLSVTVPTSMNGLVGGGGTITTESQTITNNGNLNMKLVNIAMSTKHIGHPSSTWQCYHVHDMKNPLLEGHSSSSGPVSNAPTLAPDASINLVWRGTLANTNGISLSHAPLSYASIRYTIGFTST